MSSSSLSIGDKYKIANDIQKLSKYVHLEIFFFLKEHNIKYSSNQNGYFFNMTDIPENIKVLLEKKVDFFLKNKEDLDNRYTNLIK